MSSLISVRELQKAKLAKKEIRKETYRKILEQISKKIQVSAQVGNSSLIATIPSFVMGFPTFDRTMAATYIERQLKNGGYNVKRINDIGLLIDWKVAVEKKERPEAPPKYDNDSMGVSSFLNLKKYAAKYK